ncbi:MAG: Fic family protein [bacterium]
MDPSAFTPNAPGQLVKTPEGYLAFVPNPLPPTLNLDAGGLVSELSAADRALGQLAGVGQTLPNPHLLIGPFMKREAVLSSRIEGTQASLSDLFLFEAASSAKPKAPDVQEIANYVQALEYGLQRHEELPLSLRLLREMHEHLMKEVRGENKTPGEFRRSPNWIGPPGCSLNEATFVPPPVPQMHEALHHFENYLHAQSNLPPLVRLAMIHYQFEAIHPFLDGNGRIGRILITLLLCIEKLLPQPLLYLSAYFEKHRESYYRHLLSVSHAGRWNAWISFFLRGISTQAADAVARSNRLLALREEFNRKCYAKQASGLLLKLVDCLLALPVITVSRASELLEVTPSTAKANIDKLIEAGILREITGHKRNRVYVAEQIIQTIEEPETRN